MLIGLVSDSHDNVPAIQEAVQALQDRGAEHLLHAGDVVAPFAAKAWAAFDGPITAVFGNNDGEREGLARVLDDIDDPPRTLELAGRTIVLAHAAEQIDDATRAQADLVVYGHTHRAEASREADVLTVNPGEVGGWLTGRRTCAVVDLQSLAVEIVDL